VMMSVHCYRERFGCVHLSEEVVNETIIYMDALKDGLRNGPREFR
jgi:hypothetical protein